MENESTTTILILIITGLSIIRALYHRNKDRAELGQKKIRDIPEFFSEIFLRFQYVFPIWLIENKSETNRSVKLYRTITNMINIVIYALIILLIFLYAD